MNLTQRVAPLLRDTRYFGPAVTTEDERENGRVLVRMDGRGPRPLCTARVAVARQTPLVMGQEVLLAGDNPEELYVIGVLTPPKTREPDEFNTQPDEVRFEYDPKSRKGRLSMPNGSLDLVAERGDINLQAAGNVRIDGESLELNSNELTVRTKTSRWIADRVETLAGTVVEKTKNAYRSVERLSQLTTGRMRTLVHETYHFKSKRAFLKSEEDFKIKGDKIHLG